MFSAERYLKILNYLQNNKIGNTTSMAKELYLAPSTLRRDLNILQSKNLIQRLHGGVILITKEETDYLNSYLLNKMFSHKKEKEEIGVKAAKLVNDNMSIYLDASTTVYTMVPYLKTYDNLFIITNSPFIAHELKKHHHKNVYLIAGQYKYLTGSIIGNIAAKSIHSFQINLAFIGANGYDDKYVYTSDPEEAELKIKIAATCPKTYILADLQKFNKTSFVKFAHTKSVTIITNK